MKMLKYLLFAVLIALATLVTVRLFGPFDFLSSRTEVSSTVLLDKIERVVKLTTVEGSFSEIYNYKNHYGADIWPFQKKALIRINATVAVGYDFEEVQLNIDETAKTIAVIHMPAPEILSIDHDIDYYNLESGLFNVITNQDITEMGAEAKEFIAKKAVESDLMRIAEQQRVELFDLLSMALQGAGWELIDRSDRPLG
ncbi:MAG: DUF4230 domain-containing protein [Bacteroidota bacterium]